MQPCAREGHDGVWEGVVTAIVGLCGSLRKGSFNLMLLRAAADLAPSGTAIEIASIRDVPLYDGDVEASQGIPPAVDALKARIVAADGLLIATPEYNNSIPGVLKNAIDWLSRPSADSQRVFGGRPVAIMGASLGPFGTTLAQAAWLPVLRTLGMAPWFGGRMLVPSAARVFDQDGRLIDETTRERLRKFVNGFAVFVAERTRQL
jgi:chromate reductase, NAD(P)H dehydrogenase (quinone)